MVNSKKSLRKAELIKFISKETGFLTEDVKTVIEAAFDIVRRQVVQGKNVFIADFGIFTQRSRRRGKANNLAPLRLKGLPPVPLELPEAKLPAFKPSKAFKEEVIRHAS